MTTTLIIGSLIIGLVLIAGLAMAYYIAHQEDDNDESYQENYKGFYQGDDKEILEKLNKDFRKER